MLVSVLNNSDPMIWVFLLLFATVTVWATVVSFLYIRQRAALSAVCDHLAHSYAKLIFTLEEESNVQDDNDPETPC